MELSKKAGNNMSWITCVKPLWNWVSCLLRSMLNDQKLVNGVDTIYLRS